MLAKFRELGFKDVFAIKNASNQGIDLIVRTSENLVIFVEVKTTATGRLGYLSRRQKDINRFVKEIIEAAAEGRGRYANIPADMQQRAQEILDQIRGQNSLPGLFIQIDLSGRKGMRIRGW